MRVYRPHLWAALCACLLTVLPGSLRAELIAYSGETQVAEIRPLEDGRAAVSFVWRVGPADKERFNALAAGLRSVVKGGTASRSPQQIARFVQLKGVRTTIAITRQNLTLTLAASAEVFPETLVHLENLLLMPRYSEAWYARSVEERRFDPATRTGRSEHVMFEISDYLRHPPAAAQAAPGEGGVTFGRPHQVILRSEDEVVRQRTVDLIRKLPAPSGSVFGRLGTWLADKAAGAGPDMRLPRGVIHVADPDSSEMLIMLVAARDFGSSKSLLGAYILTDYIGGSQGSEMFRIIRQEMRAAYDPRSDFAMIGPTQAVIGFSATVEASAWPEIYATITDMYQRVRQGGATPEGLELQKQRLDSRFYRKFFFDPVWGMTQYLWEYPTGQAGEIRFPLFEAFATVTPQTMRREAETLLPPLDDFLLVLIGGGPAPSEDFTAQGYCQLSKGAPLQACLADLSQAPG